MRAVLIGTRAYNDQYTDTDVICDQEFADQLSGCEQFEGTKGKVYFVHGEFEATVPNEGTAYDLILNGPQYWTNPREIDVPSQGKLYVQVASLPTLLALKKAHLILPRKWSHHIAEYGRLKNLYLGSEYKTFSPKSEGEHIRQLYRLHRKESKAIAKAHPKLNVQKNDFFGSTEAEKEYEIFDHDSIHRAIATEDVPAYTFMLDGEVWCSRKKWREMSDERKFNCVREEAAILALERSIIPALYLGKAFKGAKWAYEYALFKICTTITSGFFRDYCIERYHEAVERRPAYVEAFFDGVKDGSVEVLNHEVVCG